MRCLLFEGDYMLSKLDMDDYSKLNSSSSNTTCLLCQKNDCGESWKLYSRSARHHAVQGSQTLSIYQIYVSLLFESDYSLSDLYNDDHK